MEEMDEQIIKSDFDGDLPGIVTHLVGRVGFKEIDQWAKSFQECRDANFFGQGFKLLVNTYGYEPESIEVHKRWRSALVSYCEKRCIAVAFVNHDPYQVSELQKSASSTHNFFVDIDEAYEWLTTTQAEN
jgi:hypothetical protein